MNIDADITFVFHRGTSTAPRSGKESGHAFTARIYIIRYDAISFHYFKMKISLFVVGSVNPKLIVCVCLHSKLCSFIHGSPKGLHFEVS